MKIVSAVNAMISNSDKIEDVIPGDSGEIFFLYAGKHKWSIKKEDDGEVKLWFYPGDQSLTEIASFEQYDWQDFNEMVFYSSNELGTREARESFSELYQIVKEKRFGVDKALDDIINGSGWD